MVEIEGIKDRESLREWLNTFSDDEEVRRKAAVDIAVRAALRVLPVAWNWFSRQSDLTAMPVLRSSLLATVVRNSPTVANSKAAAAYARAAAAAADAAYARAARVAAAAARAAVAAARADAVYAAADAAAAVYAAADAAATADIWSDIQTDCRIIVEGQALGAVGLWAGDNPLAEVWSKVRSAHSPRSYGSGKYAEGSFGTVPNGPWAFWIDWYEKVLSGAPQDWDLLQAIADQVDWDGTAEEVNAAIAGIADQSGSSFGSHQELTKLRDEIEHLYSELGGLGKTQLSRTQEVEKELRVSETKLALVSGQIAELSSKTATIEKEILDQSEAFKSGFDQLNAEYENRFSSALAAFTEEQAIKGPIELWKTKEDEHHGKMQTANNWFIGGLLGVAALVVVIIFGLIWGETFLATVLTPVGCDPIENPQLCQGFSFRGMIISGAVLTLLTLSLWFTRLQMKEYLSERHLSLDARERRAFAQAYIGLLGEGEQVTEEAKAQRALVYSALFRPSSTGIIKEDGGIDPSLTAALSKILAGK